MGALLIIVVLSGVCGLLFGLLYGYNFKKFWFFKGYNLKPIMVKLKIPPLVAMIVIAMLARNLFGDYLKNAYPATWTVWIKNCILSILLTRGGLSVTFKGKGLLVILIVFIP